MPFRFDFLKTVQAVAVLLRLAGAHRRDNYMRLIKLLYIADRRSLQETGRPITGDRVVAMKHGPVLSNVLDLINDRHHRSGEWASFIERDGFEIALVQDPGNSELCPYEVDVLQAVWTEHCDRDPWQLVDETHGLAEWRKNDPGESSKEIPIADILEAVGRTDAEQIEEDAEAMNRIGRLLGADCE